MHRKMTITVDEEVYALACIEPLGRGASASLSKILYDRMC